ncbi:DUF1330 domain-containing protein [Gilvimarinus agarilyticus]|uniref:hypothetical protein n=1 Tax=Gilvimarinus agarilyticus TaxID=679259 RepID=UPI0005A10E9C|nr:hypothetical protein [Gilvimarinus agarilyticus]
MILSHYSSLLASSCLCAQLLASPVAAQPSVTDIELTPGQRLTLVLPDADPSAEAQQEQYLAGTFAIAGQQGFTEQHSFAVGEVLIGEHQPEALGIYSWPSIQSAQTMRNHPEVQRLAPLREQGWHEMHIIDVDIEQPLQMQFDARKRYTLAVLWLDDEAAYQRYLKATDPQRDAMGAKVVLIAPVAAFDSIDAPDLGDPSRIAIVEWPADVAPKSYVQSPLFTASEAIVQQAIGRIDWYELRHWGGY